MAILNDKSVKIREDVQSSKDLSKTIPKKIAVFKEERTYLEHICKTPTNT
jgi:hypothetical protein